MTQVNFTKQLIAFKEMILGLIPKSRKDTKMYASQMGLIPNINTPYVLKENSRILNKVMLIPNPFGYIVLDQTSSSQETAYYIGVTDSRAYEPYCIDLVNFRGIIEWEPGVTLYTEPGYAGIQLNRIMGENGCHLINLRLNGQLGMWTFYRRGYIDNGEVKYWNHYLEPTDKKLDWIPFGQPNSYDTDWGSYKANGIRMMGQCHITSGSVTGYAGHAIENFGHSQIRFNSTPISATGTIGRDRQYDNFIPDDQSLLSIIQAGVTLVIKDGQYLTGGMNGNGVPFRATDENSLKADTRINIQYYFRGKTLMADSCVLDGINNLTNCGGGGYFSTGDEANQYNLSNLRMANLGGPGAICSSLLKGLWISPHFTQTGEHFADRSVNPPIFHQPSFTNRGDNNASSTLLHPYYESGNQGSPIMSWNSLSLGGFNEGTMTGGHGFFNRRLKDVYIGSKEGSNIEIDSQGLRWQYGDKAVVMRVNEKLELVYGDKPLNS